MQGGAQDYLVKGRLDGTTLARSLRRAVVRQQTQIDNPRTESAQQPGKIVGYVGYAASTVPSKSNVSPKTITNPTRGLREKMTPHS